MTLMVSVALVCWMNYEKYQKIGKYKGDKNYIGN